MLGGSWGFKSYIEGEHARGIHKPLQGLNIQALGEMATGLFRLTLLAELGAEGEHAEEIPSLLLGYGRE